jgi:hypothetical protein
VPADPVDLEWYRQTGHLVLDGFLGSRRVHVAITSYAQGKMRRRDIDETEVLQALALPPSSHGRGKTEGRYEVAGPTDCGRIRVVYERPARELALVVTTHKEAD